MSDPAQARDLDATGEPTTGVGHSGDGARAGEVGGFVAVGTGGFAVEQLEALFGFGFVEGDRRWADDAAHPGLHVEQFAGADVVTGLGCFCSPQGGEQRLWRGHAELGRQAARGGAKGAVAVHHQVIHRFSLAGERAVAGAVVLEQAVPAEQIALFFKIDKVPDRRVVGRVHHVVFKRVVRQRTDVEIASTPAIEHRGGGAAVVEAGHEGR